MAVYDDLFDELQGLHPCNRIERAYERIEQLKTLSPYELDRIALLLLAASCADVKEEYPVEGESNVTRKQAFSFGMFG